MVYPQYIFFGVLQYQLWEWNICHISYIYNVSPHICSTGLLFLEKTVVTLVTLIWILTSMYSMVYYKIMYHSEPIVTGCILIWFFWSLCSLVFLSKQNIFHNGCIDKVSPHCVFSGVRLDILFKQNICHTGCIHIASPQYVFFGDVIELLSEQIIYHTGYIDKISINYEFTFSHRLQLYISPLMWAWV